MRIIKLAFGDRIIKINLNDFDKNVDVDNLLKIDYANLVAEMITFPVVVNRFGILVADMDNKIAEAKLDLEIYTAKAKRNLRRELIEVDDKGKNKNPTIGEVDDALLKDKVWQSKKKQTFEVQKERDYINSIYWSAKDKSTKLDKLSLSIQPGDVDERLIQKEINGISMKISAGLMK